MPDRGGVIDSNTLYLLTRPYLPVLKTKAYYPDLIRIIEMRICI